MLSGKHEWRKAMTDTDKLVAAIFAAAILSRTNGNNHDDYLAQYDIFINKMSEREKAAEVKVLKLSEMS
jgi:hypothetical protein